MGFLHAGELALSELRLGENNSTLNFYKNSDATQAGIRVKDTLNGHFV